MQQSGRPKVVITDFEYGWVEPEMAVLGAAGAEVEYHNCRNEDDVIRAGQGAVGLIVGYAPITRRVLEALPTLRVIARYGVGVDMIDVGAATEHGVVVANVPDYCLDEVADHTMALLLACTRKLCLLDAAVRNGSAVHDGRWNTAVIAKPVHRTNTQTLGIIGLGQIGRRVAKRAQAFGLRILAASDPGLTQAEALALGVTMLPLEEVLAQADIVSLHVPLTPTTRHILNTERFALMKTGAVVLNTSRGALIDEPALLEALRSGRLSAAGLDVHAKEPLLPDHPLCALPNVVLTSHAAWYSEEALYDLKVKTAQAAADFLSGRAPQAVLNPSLLPQALNRAQTDS